MFPSLLNKHHLEPPGDRAVLEPAYSHGRLIHLGYPPTHSTGVSAPRAGLSPRGSCTSGYPWGFCTSSRSPPSGFSYLEDSPPLSPLGSLNLTVLDSTFVGNTSNSAASVVTFSEVRRNVSLIPQILVVDGLRNTLFPQCVGTF